MLEALVELLASIKGLSAPLSWVVVAAFLLGAVVERVDRERARYVLVATWIVFAVYWATMIHYFAIEQQSFIEGIGALVAIPLSIYVAYLLANGRDSLFVLSRAVALIGVVYLPFVALDALRRPLVEMVTDHTAWVIGALGFDPAVVDGLTVEGYRIAGKHHPDESTFLFWIDGEPVTSTIRIACTGVGSMAIFVGLIGAVDAPLGKKGRALAVSLPIIYGLNIVRNAFITLSLGEQALHVFPGVVKSLFAFESPLMVSYYVADRIIAQSLSVVALVVITWLVVRELPEVLVVVEDAVFLVTGREYDLGTALGVEPATE